MFTIPALKNVLSLADQQQGALPWGGWLLLILIIILFFVLLWRWLGLSKGGEHASFPADASELKPKDTSQTHPSSEKVAQRATPVEPVSFSAPEPASEPVAGTATPQPVTAARPDDLTRIEGIGPKIAGVLQDAGVQTFAQLAAIDAATLEATLKSADLRLADPTSWPEQAKLAAAGKMDELKTLQDSLKGGRHA
jgi:predicted flap endonuclease-1-like 5' DNA nuclease